MKYIEGTPRDQLCLFEEKLDDIISEDVTESKPETPKLAVM